jgi:ATP-dependent DNA ligase
VWFERLARVGVEGLVVKAAEGRYRPGRRGWLKYKHHDGTEAVVGGVTGSLHHPRQVIVGRCCSSGGGLRVVGCTAPLDASASADLAGLLVPADGGHPWPVRLPAGWVGGLSGQALVEYVRVEPAVVAEVRVDVAAEHGRWRHPVRYLRRRGDLTPADVLPDLHLHP